MSKLWSNITPSRGGAGTRYMRGIGWVLLLVVGAGCTKPAATSAPGSAPESAPQLQADTAPAPAGAWSDGLPPNGTWKTDMTVADVERMGVAPASAPDWAGGHTWMFNDGQGRYDFEGPEHVTCIANYSLVEDVVRITYTAAAPIVAGDARCRDVTEDVRWRLDADGLHFDVVAVGGGPLAEIRAAYEAKPWGKMP